MWVIAHRGGGELFPENTLTAFVEAQNSGVDMVECDVHLSADGHMMVIHDPTLMRTGGQPLRVAELTRAELAAIDVGNGEGVPSLPDVLDRVSIPVVVEIKALEVVRALEIFLQSRPESIPRVVPISFYHAAIKHLMDAVPGLQGSVLLAGVPVHLDEVARAAGVSIVSLHFETVTADLVRAMHDAGIKVTVWSPNAQAEIDAMVAASVDGIASDRPDLVLKTVGRA